MTSGSFTATDSNSGSMRSLMKVFLSVFRPIFL